MKYSARHKDKQENDAIESKMDLKNLKQTDSYSEYTTYVDMKTESIIEESDIAEEDNMLKNEDESKTKKLPGVLIAGVKKCGTGAMMEILKLHPQIAWVGYGMTEVHFWNNDKLYQKGLDYYKVSLLLDQADCVRIAGHCLH